MMKRYLFFAFFCLILSPSFSPASAQNRANAQNRRWITEVRNYKHELLVKEVGMTPTQRDEFMPLYIAMENEIYQANREAKALEESISKANSRVSDSEYDHAANSLASLRMREGEIENAYFQKYAKILSKLQLFLLKSAENRFTRNMLEHNRRSKLINKTK